MALRATLMVEDFLSARSECVELVGIAWRLERIEIHGQRVQLLIAVPATHGNRVCRIRHFVTLDEGRRNESVEAGEHVCTLIQCRVSHQVDDAAMPLQARAVKVETIFDSDQIRHLRRVKDVGATAARTPPGIAP